MDGLISLIVWGVIISKIVKAVKGNGKKTNRQTSQQRPQMQQRSVQRTTQAQRDAYYYGTQQSTKERLQKKYGLQQPVTPKSDILSRAKENVKENAQDVIQSQMHAEVCRDYRTTAHTMPDVDIHRKVSAECDTGEESDIMKKVNDLMVTGYSGDMTFDRDFIAEGVEMLNRFSL